MAKLVDGKYDGKIWEVFSEKFLSFPVVFSKNIVGSSLRFDLS